MAGLNENFDLNSLRLSPEEMAEIVAFKADVCRPRQRKHLSCKFDYAGQLQLAEELREPVIAAQAELYRLWFKAYDKTRSIELPNTVFEKLGFDHSAKNRALRRLGKMGKVKVEWLKNKCPLVTVITF
jgi:hypothetical protein